ncbi:MAG TPA: hypothetical protein VFU15_10540 [Bacteroidia bacterium]|nr:hypothetical protein [Bacteroidia bacterium]
MKNTHRKFSFLLLASALFAAGCGTETPPKNMMTSQAPPNSTTWAISGYTVTVNGKAFFGNGVSYSPIPWGTCSAFNPYGDFTINTWSSVWQRDLTLMRANNVNLIKTYNTLDSVQLVNAGDPYTWDHDHSHFLDSCWNNGNNPVYVLMGYAPPKNQSSIFFSDTWSDPANVAARAVIKSSLVKLAKKWGSYPAVMGFVMANEINASNIINSSQFFTYWNNVALAMDSAAPGKLVTLANVDDGMNTVNAGNPYMTSPNFFWGYNSYRGNWTNSNGFDNMFSAFATATASNKHPLMLTEWGAPACAQDTGGAIINMSASQMQDLVTYVTGHYGNMVANRSDDSTGVCCGGAYFEWTDEWWKADPAGMQCNQPNAAPACHTGIWDASGTPWLPNFPGHYWDEEGFGLFSITPVSPSTRVPVVSGGCIGPWNPKTNQPYPADSLGMRPHATALFSAMKNSMAH